MGIVKLDKGIPLVSTLDICDPLGVKHAAIIKLVRKYSQQLVSIGTLGFEIRKSGGRPIEFVKLNEPQVTFLVTLMKNSDVVVDFKLTLTKEFFRMREALASLSAQSQNTEWLDARNSGKALRIEQTNAIKDFVDYAVSQGSRSASKYYMAITSMENKALFFLDQKFKNTRDALDVRQLAAIKVADGVIEKALRDGMEAQLPYKEIYVLARDRVLALSSVIGKSIVPVKYNSSLLEGPL